MSEPSSRIVHAKIYDAEYALRTTGDPDKLQQLCLDLDRRMREVAGSSGAVDTLKVAILAALSLADDLARARTQLKELDEFLSRRSLECVTMLDRFL